MSGFDCVDYYLEHCYAVRVPRSQRDDVAIFEVYGRPAKESEAVLEPESVLRAQLAKAKWDVISGEVRHEFNRRMRMAKKRSGTWSQGYNGLQRLLGKELLVLVWAVEQESVSTEQCEVANRNWLGLKPEERWWLYTMTAASTGLAHQVGLGWRSALSKALCFGTSNDVFNLGVVRGQDTLPPRRNEGFGGGGHTLKASRTEMPRLPPILKIAVA